MNPRTWLKTPLNPTTGYGISGIGLTKSLIETGYDVRLSPLFVSTPLPDYAARRLEHAPEPPFEFQLVHERPWYTALRPAPENCGPRIAWTMWEWGSFEVLPPDDLELLKYSLENIDLVVAYDYVTQQALLSVDPQAPVVVCQGGYDSGELEPVERDWTTDAFKFCMVGALNQRKNPFAVLEAFKELKAMDPAFAEVTLDLKTMSPLHPAIEDWCPGVTIHNAQWSRAQLRAFYANMHCLLAPSRGEGLNLPALEFATTGGLVSAPVHGGHAMWMGRDFTHPMDFTLKPAAGTEAATFCNVTAEQAAEAMRAIVHDRAAARKRAETAAKTVPLSAGWDGAIERFFRTISKAGYESIADTALAMRRVRRSADKH